MHLGNMKDIQRPCETLSSWLYLKVHASGDKEIMSKINRFSPPFRDMRRYRISPKQTQKVLHCRLTAFEAHRNSLERWGQPLEDAVAGQEGEGHPGVSSPASEMRVGKPRGEGPPAVASWALQSTSRLSGQNVRMAQNVGPPQAFVIAGFLCYAALVRNRLNGKFASPGY